MKIVKISEVSRKGEITLIDSGEFEFQNPLILYETLFTSSSFELERDILMLKTSEEFLSNAESILKKRAHEFWIKYRDELLLSKIDNRFKLLFSSKTKKDQIRSLKGAQFTKEQFLSLKFFAYKEYGFLLSQYMAEHGPSDMDDSALPFIANVNKENKAYKLGDSSLSDGQLIHYINFRTVIISKFLDNKDGWHCFFGTFKSISGGENSWKQGQAHIHYISDKFGFTREEVLHQLMSKKCKLGSLPHIDFI
jgi:hypothetical protein